MHVHCLALQYSTRWAQSEIDFLRHPMFKNVLYQPLERNRQIWAVPAQTVIVRIVSGSFSVVTPEI